MCTCIAGRQDGHIYLANNEDTPVPCGMLFSNQRGIRKTALMVPPDEPACWTSCYGSITFSQCGKEFPSGGMNECGLIVEQTTLRQTVYPSADARPAIKELQMIQCLLDCCRTVPEALEKMSALRIAQAAASIQYMLLDRAGDCAVVAFIDGRMLCFRDDWLPYAVLTNTHYPEALTFYESDGENAPACLDDYAANSLERFVTAVNAMQKITGTPLTTDNLFHLLEAVKRSDTLWHILYDAQTSSIHIQTRQSPARKRVELRTFDFSNEAASSAFDLQNAMSGDISSAFTEYTGALNRELIRQFFSHPTVRQVLAPDMPQHLLEYLAEYPEMLAGNDHPQVFS